MRVQINKEGRTRYNRQYFFPNSKENRIYTDVSFGYNESYWGKFTVAEIPFKTLSIVCRCPHCGLQIYGIWYRGEEFIAKKMEVGYNKTYTFCFKPEYFLDKYGITFSKLWDLAKREQEAYANTSKRIEAEIRAFRAMETCPDCGETLSQKSEDERNGEPSEYFIDDTFRNFIYNYRNYSSVNANEVIKNIKNTTLCQDVDIDRGRLANNADLLLKYIKHILDTEMTVQLLEKRLFSLYSSRMRYHEAYIRQQAEEMSVIAADQFYGLDVREPAIDDVVLAETMPTKPQFKKNPPIEPQYEKPGLFNKKKILAHNELLRSNYEMDCQAYILEKTEYEKLLNEYHAALNLYNKKREYAFACLLEEHKQKETTRRAAYFADVNQRKAEITERLGTYILYQETLKEIQQTEELYAQSYACLQSLYSCGVVYEKYRNPVALASFYDYLAAGRCTTLSGADGAYNIFENEVRLDRIVTKLDVVIKQLEQIKDNQYALYSEMSKMNANLETINSTARSMAASLENIKDYQKNISDNTAIIAHNTAVTAFYAKKNAELTNALGFMVALK